MSANATGSSGAPSRPWQAEIEGRLTRIVGVDEIEEVDYRDGVFTRRTRIAGGFSPGAILVLDEQARQGLLDELRAELDSSPPGADTVGLRVFITLLEDSLQSGGDSDRFRSARFGVVSRDESRGILYGHLTLGVDVVGTVRDESGTLSFEQHVVVLPPGPYRPLSPDDRASLAGAIEANPPDDPLWQDIRADARR